jgi:mannan endo-1,4-beta-mannosidase
MRMDRRLRFGVSTLGGACELDEVADIAAAVGRRPEMVLWFEDFAADPPVGGIRRVAATGAMPVITWEPWLWRTDRQRDAGALMPQIAAGEHDAHLIAWADALAGTEPPVTIRFAHEFNGDWYPWSPTGGTSPEAYIEAWRHVHDLFHTRGTDHVQWMWAPAAANSAHHELEAWYPGDDCVDVIGIDGYNWGITQPWSRWMPPTEIFASTLAEVQQIADKPVLIAEVGCAESGGDKAQWIGEFVEWLTAEDVDGFVWFDHDKETDWRIRSTPRSAAAMAAALSEVET